MAGVAQLLFGGTGPAPQIFMQPSPGPQPEAPKPDNAAAEEAARKERLAMQQGVGRSNTILTDFALATTSPNTIKQTLGGA